MGRAEQGCAAGKLRFKCIVHTKVCLALSEQTPHMSPGEVGSKLKQIHYFVTSESGFWI